MYQEMKDLRKAIERQHQAAEAGANVHTGELNAYYLGKMNAFYHVLGLIDAALDEYENSDQPTPAEIATSDLVDYKALMECCRP